MKKRKEFLSVVKSLKEARNKADEWVEDYFRKLVNIAIKSKDHFAYEGHFRDPTTLNVPKRFKRNGYSLSLIFMGLTDPDLSELRVLDRAKHGGHYVPAYEIQSNFYGNLIMLNKNLNLFDEVLIIDSSLSLQHKILFHVRNSRIISYSQEANLPFWFTKFLPNVLKMVVAEETKKRDKKKS